MCRGQVPVQVPHCLKSIVIILLTATLRIMTLSPCHGRLTGAVNEKPSKDSLTTAEQESIRCVVQWASDIKCRLKLMTCHQVDKLAAILLPCYVFPNGYVLCISTLRFYLPPPKRITPPHANTGCNVWLSWTILSQHHLLWPAVTRQGLRLHSFTSTSTWNPFSLMMLGIEPGSGTFRHSKVAVLKQTSLDKYSLLWLTAALQGLRQRETVHSTGGLRNMCPWSFHLQSKFSDTEELGVFSSVSMLSSQERMWCQ